MLYLHAWDFTTPVEEVMRSLNDIVSMGKVHYIGVSDTPAWIVAHANTLASMRGWAQFVVYQGKYNPAERAAELELLPMCHTMGLAFIPWGLQPWCARYNGECKVPAPHKNDGPCSADVDAVVVRLAGEHRATPEQVVLAWALRKPCFASVLLTCRTPAALDECVGALAVRLAPEQSAAIDRAAKYKTTYPYDYIGCSYQSSPWFKTAGTISTQTHPLSGC